MIIICDFETRSKADLKVVGAWKYSLHPSTDALCLAWYASNGEKGLWHRGHPCISASPLPTRLFELISDPSTLLCAHNAFFERAIWLNVCVAKLGWPSVLESQWRCSAAQAAACSLPRALGAVGHALKLDVVKDDEGKRVMMKVSKMAKATKKLPERWNESIDDLMDTWDYCEQDVMAERALHLSIPELSAKEQRVWEVTEAMNLRGVPIDVEGAQRALELAAEHVRRLNVELLEITKTISSAGQRAKVTRWLQDQGVTIEDTTAATLDALLKDPDPFHLSDKARRVIEIVRSAGRTSTKKYDAMIEMACQDARAYGLVMYHGASTGRLTGKGLQPHNFPRGRKDVNKNMDLAWDMIHHGSLEDIEMCYGDPMEFLSCAIRGAIKAPEGRIFYCGDYAAIEARVVFWLADEKHGLNLFRRGEDVYCDMASDIYGRKITKADEKERMFGKQAILGLGFQMGFVKFLITCRSYNISFTKKQIIDIVGPGNYVNIAQWIQDKAWGSVKKQMPGATVDDLPSLVLMKYVVERYRNRYPAVPKLWEKYNEASIRAVQNPGKRYRVGRVSWFMRNEFLCCELPSGRLMRYPFPQVENGRYGEKLTYMTIDSVTNQWVRVDTYGGKEVENATQAVARDVQVDANTRLEDSGIYFPILTVHDELVSEADEGSGSLEEYDRLMVVGSEWADGLPIAVESWRGFRYRK